MQNADQTPTDPEQQPAPGTPDSASPAPSEPTVGSEPSSAAEGSVDPAPGSQAAGSPAGDSAAPGSPTPDNSAPVGDTPPAADYSSSRPSQPPARAVRPRPLLVIVGVLLVVGAVVAGLTLLLGGTGKSKNTEVHVTPSSPPLVGAEQVVGSDLQQMDQAINGLDDAPLQDASLDNQQVGLQQ